MIVIETDGDHMVEIEFEPKWAAVEISANEGPTATLNYEELCELITALEDAKQEVGT